MGRVRVGVVAMALLVVGVACGPPDRTRAEAEEALWEAEAVYGAVVEEALGEGV